MEELKSNKHTCIAPLFVFFVPVLLIGAFANLLSFQLPCAKAESATEVGFLKEGECDLFNGEWMEDNYALVYTNDTCRYISDAQNCMKNGRPDTGYLYWKWKPRDCYLPQLNAVKFLNFMKNKSLAFIGDSILRNQMESLLCFLSKVEEAVLVYHDNLFQTTTWHFPAHNATFRLIWAPFLIKSSESQSNHNLQIWLDRLDEAWTKQYHNYNLILISGGQWFLREAVIWDKGKIVGCHYCPGKNLTELGMDYAYRRALELAFRFMSTSEHRPELVVLRTWTPNHYSGGICNRTRPYTEGENRGDDYVGEIMRGLEIEEFEKGVKSGVPLKLLDTYYLSSLRPDGHPGPYGRFHPDVTKRPQNDCLHWCLPGPIDAWNELLVHVVLNGAEFKSGY